MTKVEKVGSIIFHCLIITHDIASLVWLRKIGGFSWKSAFYFTIWSLMLQITASFVLLLSDIASILKNKESKKSTSLTNVSDGNMSLYKFVLFHLSFVATIATGIMFWSIYAIDPTALNPKDFYYPLLLNNMHHTFPWMLSLIQVFVFAKREVNSFALKIDLIRATEIGMGSMFFLAILYSLTALSKRAFLGKFPYPFMNDLTRIQYTIFNVFLVAFGLMISNISTQLLFKIAKTMRKQTAVNKQN